MNAWTELPVPNSFFGLPGEPPHEEVHLCADPSRGLRAIIVIHSTARGPGFGGCRLWTYAHDQDALTDALRLSQGMSLKNALADLPFGGAKAVILKPQGPFDRAALFEAFGEAVTRLNGRYITAEDVGTTTADMRVVRRRSAFVSGLPREGAFGGDPSPWTAWGVFVAIREGLRLHLKRTLSDAVVAVQGLGSVGMNLCARLNDAGARLVVSDVDEGRCHEAGARFGARVVGPHCILFEPVDVLAPCALGAVLDRRTVGRVQAPIIAGAANNQLATLEDGDRLQERGVLYLPDFLSSTPAGSSAPSASTWARAPCMWSETKSRASVIAWPNCWNARRGKRLHGLRKRGLERGCARRRTRRGSVEVPMKKPRDRLKSSAEEGDLWGLPPYQTAMMSCLCRCAG
jgi:leucine dehydrogenase